MCVPQHTERDQRTTWRNPFSLPTFPWGLGFEPWLSGLRREHFDPLSSLAGPRQAIFRHESGRNGLGESGTVRFEAVPLRGGVSWDCLPDLCQPRSPAVCRKVGSVGKRPSVLHRDVGRHRHCCLWWQWLCALCPYPALNLPKSQPQGPESFCPPGNQ